MSLFDNIKKKRQQDTKETRETEPASVEEQPERERKELKKPKEPPSMMEKISEKEINEDIVELSNGEKSEFINIMRGRYNDIKQEIKKVQGELEEMKLQEKDKLEKKYRKAMSDIDDKYEKYRLQLKEKFAPALQRYKSLAEKFEAHVEVNEYENLSRGKTKTYEYQDKSEERVEFDPEVSRLFDKIENKINPGRI